MLKANTMLRQSFAPVLRNQTRLFATTQVTFKSPIDSAKEAIKKVDRTISDAAVSGIEKGQQAKDSAKASVGAGASEAKDKAEELKGEAKGKAEELKGEAKGKAEEVKSKM